MFTLISEDTLKHVNLSESNLQVNLAMLIRKCATLHMKKYPKPKNKVKPIKKEHYTLWKSENFTKENINILCFLKQNMVIMD